MTVDLWIYLALLAIAILLYFSARFSGAETAITAIDAVEVAELAAQGKKNAQFLVKVKSDLDRTIVAILIGNARCGVSMANHARVSAADQRVDAFRRLRCDRSRADHSDQHEPQHEDHAQ